MTFYLSDSKPWHDISAVLSETPLKWLSISGARPKNLHECGILLSWRHPKRAVFLPETILDQARCSEKGSPGGLGEAGDNEFWLMLGGPWESLSWIISKPLRRLLLRFEQRPG